MHFVPALPISQLAAGMQARKAIGSAYLISGAPIQKPNRSPRLRQPTQDASPSDRRALKNPSGSILMLARAKFKIGCTHTVVSLLILHC
jgi:hypothetical protein